MTETELFKWMSYHGARNPRFSNWVNKVSKHDYEPAPRDKRDACLEALKTVSLEDAMRATDTFSCGSETFTDTFACGSHARDVARLASSRHADAHRYRQPPTQDGDETYRCSMCLDTGLVVVFSRDFVRWFSRWLDEQTGDIFADSDYLSLRDGGGSATSYVSAACCCSCRPKHKGWATFDPIRHVPIYGAALHRHSLEPLIAWIAKREHGTPADEWDPDTCVQREAF